jgi:RNA polymerase sigma-70 factor (ECF subfamily)
VEKMFNDLFTKYHHDLFNFLYYMVHNREQAEDLVQEVYIRVFKSSQQFKGECSQKTWLFAIARNVAIDCFRKQKGLKQRVLANFDLPQWEIKDCSPLPEEIINQKEKTLLMYHCLEQCSLDQKCVIILRFIQELSISETAQALGWKESKVKTTQHRAIKQLRMFMKEALKNEKVG